MPQTSRRDRHKLESQPPESQQPQNQGSNVVYKRLREHGYDVFAVNPNADEVRGDTCCLDVESVPGVRHGSSRSTIRVGEWMQRADGVWVPRVLSGS